MTNPNTNPNTVKVTALQDWSDSSPIISEYPTLEEAFRVAGVWRELGFFALVTVEVGR